MIKIEEKDEIDKLKNELSIEGEVDSPSVRLVNSIIEQAISKKTSDIHIEPFENCVYVRFRIDGILHEIKKLPKSVYKSINIRIKIIAKMNITLKMEPQDGKIDTFKDYSNCNFRVSSIPTIYGEKFVIRVLYKTSKFMKIEDITKGNAKCIKEIISKPNGIILLTGPTGSGKSSTAYSILNEFNRLEKNIVTIEDPVEFTMERINQINVNKKANLTFAAGLKSVLRQDPDIIFVGEIRDEETAKVAVRAAITGHLVISTLHTNDAPGVIPRLRDMGIKSYLLCDALTAAIAQRLVRKICPFCKESYTPSNFEKNLFNLNGNEVLYRGHGCVKCNNTGYVGRTAIFEIMKIDNVLRKSIYENKSIEEIKKHCANSKMLSLSQNAKELVKKGITTTYEYIKIINIEDDSR